MKRSGRTKRMIEDAIRLAREGKSVYIVAAAQDVDRIKDRVGAGYGIKVETFSTLRNLRLFGPGAEIRLEGVHPNHCCVLIDHYAIEKNFAAVLEMLHRYDGGEE